MPKRHTTIRLSQLTDHQLRELTERWDMTATEVVALAVDRLYREQRWGRPDHAMDPPTLVVTLIYDRLGAALLSDLDREAALDWCYRWVREHATVGYETLAEDVHEARIAADAAVAAWTKRSRRREAG